MQDKDKQVFRHIRCGLCVFQHQDRLMIYIEPISGNKHHVLRFCQIQILESVWHAYIKLHLFDNQKLSNRCFFIPGKFNISLYSQLYSISCLLRSDRKRLFKPNSVVFSVSQKLVYVLTDSLVTFCMNWEAGEKALTWRAFVWISKYIW